MKNAAKTKHQPAAPAPIDRTSSPTKRNSKNNPLAAAPPTPPASSPISPSPCAARPLLPPTPHASPTPQAPTHRRLAHGTDVATAVTARLRTQLPHSVLRSTIKTLLPTAALEALVTQIAVEAIDVLAAAWSRAVAEETARAAAAATHHQELAQIAGQWNQRSRPVGLLGSPGLGCGVNVLPY